MKSVTLTPCWLVQEIIGAAEFEAAKPHTNARCGLSNIIFENVTPSSGKVTDAVSGEHEIAASVSGSRTVPCSIAKSIGSVDSRYNVLLNEIDPGHAVLLKTSVSHAAVRYSALNIKN